MPEKKIVYEGHMPKLLGFISARYNINSDSMLAAVATEFPHILEKDNCANCKANMVAYEVPFDCMNALLLKAMADHVRDRLRKGMPMEVANQVLVSLLPVSDGVKRRTSQVGKLAFIRKVKNDRKNHVKGVWAINPRGWAALRGEAARKWTMVFRNQIVKRSETEPEPQTITMAQAFQIHRDKVEKAIAKQRPPKNDYRALMDDYSPNDWFEYGDTQQGALI